MLQCVHSLFKNHIYVIHNTTYIHTYIYLFCSRLIHIYVCTGSTAAGPPGGGVVRRRDPGGGRAQERPGQHRLQVQPLRPHRGGVHPALAEDQVRVAHRLSVVAFTHCVCMSICVYMCVVQCDARLLRPSAGAHGVRGGGLQPSPVPERRRVALRRAAQRRARPDRALG